jgi:hypothetical protein
MRGWQSQYEYEVVERWGSSLPCGLDIDLPVSVQQLIIRSFLSFQRKKIRRLSSSNREKFLRPRGSSTIRDPAWHLSALTISSILASDDRQHKFTLDGQRAAIILGNREATFRYGVRRRWGRWFHGVETFQKQRWSWRLRATSM